MNSEIGVGKRSSVEIRFESGTRIVCGVKIATSLNHDQVRAKAGPESGSRHYKNLVVKEMRAVCLRGRAGAGGGGTILRPRSFILLRVYALGSTGNYASLRTETKRSAPLCAASRRGGRPRSARRRALIILALDVASRLRVRFYDFYRSSWRDERGGRPRRVGSTGLRGRERSARVAGRERSHSVDSLAIGFKGKFVENSFVSTRDCDRPRTPAANEQNYYGFR
ncbi:hypothetical protein EVAR_94538_1 [Eumeta japonica]|uniref:Uncharacterized protein n=1 Tax=Eumeta variegata TaxID=151549 RepID=A0A4C1UVA7_EUMVA|nr:hypothetical protein EVAR_94538_1 [Eumeta japonica]